MNDKIEEVYAKMFAPRPIPIEVIELYDKVNFFIKRAGLPGMKITDLCLIAGVALTKKGRPDVESEADYDGHQIIDTSEDNDYEEPIESADMLAVEDEGEIPEPKPMQDVKTPAPKGPMDAPSAPSQRRRANLEAVLMKMTKSELLAHAQDICKIPLNTIVGRQRGKAAKSEIDKVSKQHIIKLIMEA